MMTSVIILILGAALSQNELYAQTNSKYWKDYHYFISFGAGPSQSRIINKFPDDLKQSVAVHASSLSFFFETGYYFSNYLGITSGIGLSPYKTILSLDHYSSSFYTVDSEGDYYERRISANQIKEVQKISFLEIPLLLCLNYPYSRIIGLYLQAGINMSIPIVNNYSSSGSFTYSGYYPEYNVLLQELPYEGFASNVQYKDKGELCLNKLNPQAVTVGGFYFYIEKQVQISIGFLYKRMITNLSDNQTTEPIQLSTSDGKIRSLMEGCSKAFACSAGVMVSLRYFIK